MVGAAHVPLAARRRDVVATRRHRAVTAAARAAPRPAHPPRALHRRHRSPAGRSRQRRRPVTRVMRPPRHFGAPGTFSPLSEMFFFYQLTVSSFYFVI